MLEAIAIAVDQPTSIRDFMCNDSYDRVTYSSARNDNERSELSAVTCGINYCIWPTCIMQSILLLF